MSKVLFIGKFNEITRKINQYLTDFLQVQFCENNPEVVKGMFKLYLPNLVLISLQDADEKDMPVFRELANFYSNIPVLTFGPEENRKLFDSYYQTNQFQHLSTPYASSDIKRRILQILGVSEQQAITTAGRTGEGKKHILVVDDNPVLLRSMKGILQDTYQVSLATSGAQALSTIGKDRPDLVFMDYDMPICDGKTTFAMMRSEEEMRQIPVVFLTGVSDKEHIQEVLSLKPAAYLLKPVSSAKIMATIEKVFSELE